MCESFCKYILLHTKGDGLGDTFVVHINQRQNFDAGS